MQTAPRAGLVFHTYYLTGESVPASYPVVCILPPAGITVRFFVPETDLATLSTGRDVTVRLDGTTREYRATVSYISPRAEYTPPVIYSRNTRAKLVYLIEARLPAEEAAQLHPGQPVDVLPEPAHD